GAGGGRAAARRRALPQLPRCATFGVRRRAGRVRRAPALPRRDPGGHRVKVHANGVDLFFDVEGTKLVADGPWVRERPTVVMLPTGPGLDHSLYKEHVGPSLAEDLQVIYLDQRGSGRSDWSSEEHWTLDTWVDDLAAFYDALELERPLLFGTGIGGAR